MQTWQLSPLTVSDYLMLTMGQDGVVPFQVVANETFELSYDPVAQGVLAGPMVGQGGTPSATQAASFVDNLLFALSSSVTGIAGITDIFNPQKDYEILQFWFGISPDYIRVWVKQPYNTWTSTMDGNIIPSSSYPDVGYVDGYDSPYNMPAPVTEQFALKNLSVSWSLQNPTNGPSVAPMVWNPRFNFYINRMKVAPVKSASVVAALLQGRRTAKRYTLGDPTLSTPYDPGSYGGASPIDITLSQHPTPELIMLLEDAGYLTDEQYLSSRIKSRAKQAADEAEDDAAMGRRGR